MNAVNLKENMTRSPTLGDVSTRGHVKSSRNGKMSKLIIIAQGIMDKVYNSIIGLFVKGFNCMTGLMSFNMVLKVTVHF